MKRRLFVLMFVVLSMFICNGVGAQQNSIDLSKIKNPAIRAQLQRLQNKINAKRKALEKKKAKAVNNTQNKTDNKNQTDIKTDESNIPKQMHEPKVTTEHQVPKTVISSIDFMESDEKLQLNLKVMNITLPVKEEDLSIIIDGTKITYSVDPNGTIACELPDWGVKGYSGELIVDYRGAKSLPIYLLSWEGKAQCKTTDISFGNAPLEEQFTTLLKLRAISKTPDLIHGNVDEMIIDSSSSIEYSGSGQAQSINVDTKKVNRTTTWSTEGTGTAKFKKNLIYKNISISGWPYFEIGPYYIITQRCIRQVEEIDGNKNVSINPLTSCLTINSAIDLNGNISQGSNFFISGKRRTDSTWSDFINKTPDFPDISKLAEDNTANTQNNKPMEYNAVLSTECNSSDRSLIVVSTYSQPCIPPDRLKLTVNGIPLKLYKHEGNNTYSFETPEWGKPGYTGEIVLWNGKQKSHSMYLWAWNGKISCNTTCGNTSFKSNYDADLRLRAIGKSDTETPDGVLYMDPSSTGTYSASGTNETKQQHAGDHIMKWKTGGDGILTWNHGLGTAEYGNAFCEAGTAHNGVVNLAFQVGKSGEKGIQEICGRIVEIIATRQNKTIIDPSLNIRVLPFFKSNSASTAAGDFEEGESKISEDGQDIHFVWSTIKKMTP